MYFLLVHTLFTLWTRTSEGYWVDLPYAPRERDRAEALLTHYQTTWSDREYALAPAGFTPNLGWCG